MKISEYEKLKGRLQILNDCDRDLKLVRQHLIRECNIEKGYDLSKVMKKYKELLKKETKKSVSEILLNEFLNKINDTED